MTTELNEKEISPTKRIDAIYWAAVFIWAGLIFGIDNFERLPEIGNATAWSWVFAGAGLIALLGNIIRVSAPDWPNPTTWDYIWSGFWLVLGLSGFFAVDIFWPVVLTLAGAAILVNTFRDK